MAKDNPETNPITIKPETASHVTELLSWVPLPCCSPPRRPFPIKSLALSADVSPRTIHFRELDKSPVSGPGRGPPSCNISFHIIPNELLMSPSASLQSLVWGFLLNICVSYIDMKLLFQRLCEFLFSFRD